jgi:hypothetical protein
MCLLQGVINVRLRIGECPSNSPFPRPIVGKEWRDTRTFSNLKSTHCTFLILLIINLVAKKARVKYNDVSSTPRLSGIRTHNVSGESHCLHM